MLINANHQRHLVFYYLTKDTRFGFVLLQLSRLTTLLGANATSCRLTEGRSVLERKKIYDFSRELTATRGRVHGHSPLKERLHKRVRHANKADNR